MFIIILIHIVDGGRWLHFKGDGPANQGFWWSVRATPQVDKMKGGFLVDVNIRSSELWS